MLKKNFLAFVLFIFTICLVLFSSSNFIAAKTGLYLWANSVLPSLFPFFVATELLAQTNMPNILGKIFNPFMKPLFNIKGEGSFPLIMGIISGYPIGAKITCKFREKNILSKVECERLLSFTNNSGPLFIVGTVGISMYGNSTIGFLLLITHFLSCLTVGFLFRFWKSPRKKRNYISSCSPSESGNINISELGDAISNSIKNATSTILMIGGFVVMFSVIISILNSTKFLYLVSPAFTPIFSILHIPFSFIIPILTGFLEITNGISLLSAIHIKTISTNIILTAFLLGIGGFSVFLQVLSIVSKSDLSIKPYVIGKILQAIFAVIYTFILIKIFPIFNFNL